jgi:hypothetical protein
MVSDNAGRTAPDTTSGLDGSVSSRNGFRRLPHPRSPSPAAGLTDNQLRRTAADTCGWCRGPIQPRVRGPIPE